MAQKPYKHNIEYIEKYYSYGSEAKVIEFKPAFQEKKNPVPKQEKEPVTTLCIDPIAFCGLMVAVVMLVVMIAGVIHFNVISQDHAIMENYVMQLREENILLTHKYNAYFDMQKVRETAVALGMIPVGQARTITVQVEIPAVEPEMTWWDDLVWFFSGLFA